MESVAARKGVQMHWNWLLLGVLEMICSSLSYVPFLSIFVTSSKKWIVPLEAYAALGLYRQDPWTQE